MNYQFYTNMDTYIEMFPVFKTKPVLYGSFIWLALNRSQNVLSKTKQKPQLHWNVSDVKNYAIILWKACLRYCCKLAVWERCRVPGHHILLQLFKDCSMGDRKVQKSWTWFFPIWRPGRIMLLSGIPRHGTDGMVCQWDSTIKSWVHTETSRYPSQWP